MHHIFYPSTKITYKIKFLINFYWKQLLENIVFLFHFSGLVQLLIFFLYWNLVGVCVWGRAKTDFKNLTFTHSIYICLKQSVYFTSSFFCLIKSSTFDPTLQKVSLCQNYVHTKTTIQTMNTSMTINSVFPNRD